MRIAFVYGAVYPWVSGGAERRNHELARRLAERHEVHMVAWQWWEGPSTMKRDGVTYHGIGRPPAMYGADGKRTVREALAFGVRVLPFLLRHRWDVIDCSATPYLPVYPVWLASRLTRVRLVVTWHEFWGAHWGEYLPRRPVVARVARVLERGTRSLGDRLVAVSGFTARALGMAGSPRLEVVPNGVDTGAIAASQPAADAAPLLFLGRLIDEKRVELVVEAVAQAATGRRDIRCDVVGDGPQRAALERLAAALRVTDAIRFLGHLSPAEVSSRLRAARLLLMPSAREGYSMAVAEAQAAGTVPIVAKGPFTAAPELVSDGVDGLLVEPTAQAFAEAMVGLLDDEARLASLSGAARRTGMSRDWDRRAMEMERVYLAAIGDRRAKGTRRSLGWR